MVNMASELPSPLGEFEVRTPRSLGAANRPPSASTLRVGPGRATGGQLSGQRQRSASSRSASALRTRVAERRGDRGVDSKKRQNSSSSSSLARKRDRRGCPREGKKRKFVQTRYGNWVRWDPPTPKVKSEVGLQAAIQTDRKHRAEMKKEAQRRERNEKKATFVEEEREVEPQAIQELLGCWASCEAELQQEKEKTKGRLETARQNAAKKAEAAELTAAQQRMVQMQAKFDKEILRLKVQLREEYEAKISLVKDWDERYDTLKRESQMSERRATEMQEGRHSPNEE